MSRDSDIKLVAMDLDGTLTQHKSPLESECREVLVALSRRYRTLMVCAGGCERVHQQMDGFPVDIIGYYGMQSSAVVSGKLTILENHVAAVDRESVLARVESLRCELGLSGYSGDPIEFHASGSLTFPILGTAAPLDMKLAYDPDRRKRRSYYRKVCEAFGDYTVFIGGTSSFDLVPRPYGKLYAIDRYLEAKGLARADVVYFGDDYGMGGNDADVFGSDIEFIRIDDYREFPETARRSLLE